MYASQRFDGVGKIYSDSETVVKALNLLDQDFFEMQSPADGPYLLVAGSDEEGIEEPIYVAVHVLAKDADAPISLEIKDAAARTTKAVQIKRSREQITQEEMKEVPESLELIVSVLPELFPIG